MKASAIINSMNDYANPMLPCLLRVNRVRRETHNTFTIELEPNDAMIKHGFLPGQFNMLYVFGVGEIPISISGHPGKKEKLVHTIRAVGAVSGAMKKLKRGDVVGVRGPFGTSWPLESASGNDVMIIAGGIGLAPLMPMLYALVSKREKYGNIAILYGTRTPEDILFRKMLERWRSQLDLQVFVTVDRAEGKWKGNVGVVTKLIRKATFDPAKVVVAMCGPEIMMRFTGIELEKQGISKNRIFLSMERNMKCAIGFCGHCQLGPRFICKDGAVFRYDEMAPFLTKREI